MNLVKKLGLSLVVFMTAFYMQAATETVDGITWNYTVNSGKAEIYKGSSSAAISSSTTGEITIPSTLGGYAVTGIGAYAFYNCSSIVSIKIPDTVTSIGKSAFYYCRSLQTINIPKGVTSIEDSTFYDCDSLVSIVIPEGVKSIGLSAFSSCDALKNVVARESKRTIAQVNAPTSAM